MQYAAPVTLNGYQLRDALSLIAPAGTPEQLRTRLCIEPGPARLTDNGAEPAGLFCWLEQWPGEGSVRLDEQPREATPAGPSPEQMLAIVHQLIEAARWIYSDSDARRQPNARALAKAVLRLTAPIINSHIDALCREAHAPIVGAPL